MSKFKRVSPPVGTEPIPMLLEEDRADRGDLTTPTTKDEELPIVYSLGVAKVKGGWAVVMTKSQGTAILDTEAIGGPGPFPVAIEQYKIAAVRHLFPTLQKAYNG